MLLMNFLPLNNKRVLVLVSLYPLSLPRLASTVGWLQTTLRPWMLNIEFYHCFRWYQFFSSWEGIRGSTYIEFSFFFSRRNESHRELCRSREKKILLLWKLYNNSRRASIKTKMKICFYPLKRTFSIILTQPVMTLWSVGTFFYSIWI